MNHTKLSTITLKGRKDVNEIWLHDQIVKDPAILGLGDVVVKDRERANVGGGRLDLLLQDAEGHGRYEVEIQLGATDPSHIIRTIEYWDLQRKQFPQYDHTAVIIAEDITSRFLNVIGLFNGSIPIMAFQMTAVQMPDGIGLLFTKIVDVQQLGFVEEDEHVNEPTDRGYWETRSSVASLKMADQILELCRPFATKVELNYNKHYIGFRVDGMARNFSVCRPRKSALNLSIKIPQSEEVDKELDALGLDLLDYDKKWQEYRIRLSPPDVEKHGAYLKGLLQKAFDYRTQD